MIATTVAKIDNVKGNDIVVFICRSFAAKMAAAGQERLTAEELKTSEIRDKFEEAIDETQDANFSASEVWLSASVKIIEDKEMLERVREERRKARQRPPKWLSESIEEEAEAEKKAEEEALPNIFHEEELDETEEKPKTQRKKTGPRKQLLYR